MTDRTDEIRRKAKRLIEIANNPYCLGPVSLLDGVKEVVPALLGEIDRLTEAHEAMLRDLKTRTKQVEALERERDEYKAALQNWHEDGLQEAGRWGAE